jgi:hypothetical protein
VQPKGKATAHLKMGALKRTVWQWRAAKVRQCCGEIAARSDTLREGLSPMVAAIAVSSQATVLAYQ